MGCFISKDKYFIPCLMGQLISYSYDFTDEAYV